MPIAQFEDDDAVVGVTSTRRRDSINISGSDDSDSVSGGDGCPPVFNGGGTTNTEETPPPSEVAENTSETGNCSNRVITVFGWTFDFFTVAISITDVISDVLVAMQFLRDGHTLWAWLVFGTFMNASLVYSGLVVAIMFDRYNNDFNARNGAHILPQCVLNLPKVLQFLIVLPFSQLAPTGMYFLQMFILPYLRGEPFGTNGTSQGDESSVAFLNQFNESSPLCRDAMAKVNMEEAANVRATFTVVGRLKDAIQRQIVTHGMLFAETIVESIPQSIIQLLAITFLGAPSTLQVVSMALSLLSVVSKAYFVSLSFDVRVFLFKFAVVSFDVMSMFYVFCTVLSQERAEDVALFGSSALSVSYLSYAWFIKVCVMTGWTVLVGGLGTLTLIIADHIVNDRCDCNCHFSWSTIKELMLVVLIVIFAFVPVVLVQESAKLSWIVFFLFRWEPRADHTPQASIMYAFLQRCDGDAKERWERLVHLLMEAYKQPGAWSSYNNGANNLLFTTPFLHEHIAFLSELESVVTAKYGDGKQCMESLKASESPLYNKWVRIPQHSSFAQENRMRRAPVRLPCLFDAERHPWGYRSLDNTRFEMSNEDRLVYNMLVDESKELREKLKLEPQMQFQPHRRMGTTNVFDERVGIVLRDREVHEVLKEYRAERDRLANALSPEVCSANVRSPDGGDDAGEMAENRDVVGDEADDVGEYVSPQERLRRWTFRRIFNPHRLNFFWSRVHNAEPPIDFYPVDHYGYGDPKAVNPIAFLFWGWFAVNVLNCAFSIGFVFVSFVMDYESQNLLQVFCFWSCVFFLVMAAVQVRHVWHYAQLLKPISALSELLPYDGYSAQCNSIQRSVVSFYEVQPQQVVHFAVPCALLPDDVMSVVSEFVGPRGYDSSSLTPAECLAMKRQFRSL